MVRPMTRPVLPSMPAPLRTFSDAQHAVPKAVLDGRQRRRATNMSRKIPAKKITTLSFWSIVLAPLISGLMAFASVLHPVPSRCRDSLFVTVPCTITHDSGKSPDVQILTARLAGLLRRRFKGFDYFVES